MLRWRYNNWPRKVVEAVKCQPTTLVESATPSFLRPSFTVFVGNDLIAFKRLAVGADDGIVAVVKIVPSRAVKLHRLLAVEQNLKAAREIGFYSTGSPHKASFEPVSSSP